MERKLFNVQDWLYKTSAQPKVAKSKIYHICPEIVEVENIIQKIETNTIDIINNYSDWVNVGFSFADKWRKRQKPIS